MMNGFVDVFLHVLIQLVDGALDIEHDPCRGLVKIEQGIMFPIGESGIGNPSFD